MPSSEQKQSGNTQTEGSHGGARFGSVSISEDEIMQKGKVRFAVKVKPSNIFDIIASN